jgi:hypothetical protein
VRRPCPPLVPRSVLGQARARPLPHGGALLAAGALATLTVARPSLPHIASLTAAVSLASTRKLALCLAWLLAVYVAVTVLVRALKFSVRRRARTELPSVLPVRVSSPPSDPTQRFRRRFSWTPMRSDEDEVGSVPALVATVSIAKAPVAPPAAEQSVPVGVSVRRAASEPPPATSISLLGPLRIAGTIRPIRRGPTRELIAYLALHPRGASRDELADALWPQLDA